ncbi:hypothetical protein N875_02985 [Neisseria meningitidis LNP21362]|nr:hypothetical protein N875_02985 [Neisseria meningitidis LNP21362]
MQTASGGNQNPFSPERVSARRNAAPKDGVPPVKEQ